MKTEKKFWCDGEGGTWSVVVPVGTSHLEIGAECPYCKYWSPEYTITMIDFERYLFACKRVYHARLPVRFFQIARDSNGEPVAQIHDLAAVSGVIGFSKEPRQ